MTEKKNILASLPPWAVSVLFVAFCAALLLWVLYWKSHFAVWVITGPALMALMWRNQFDLWPNRSRQPALFWLLFSSFAIMSGYAIWHFAHQLLGSA